jgi:hypothetical protein
MKSAECNDNPATVWAVAADITASNVIRYPLDAT